MTINDFFTLYTGAFVATVTILGLLVGSFLNVVIYRLPLMMEREWHEQCRELLENETAPAPKGNVKETFNLAVPRSRCPNCNHAISSLENIPVLSYLFLRGRCSQCSNPISMRYPIIEAVSGLLSALIAYQFGWSATTLLLLLLTWALISLTMIDYDHQLLPDSITLPLLWLGLIANSFGLITDLSSAVWGAIGGYLILWCVYWAFKLLTGKEGMGFGDFKLLAALGAWMGWQFLPLIIILSSLVGALVGGALIAFQGREQGKPIPFGPFLAGAGWLAMLWGSDMIQIYFRWAGLS